MRQAILDTDTVSFFFRGERNVINKIDIYIREYGYVNISIVTYYEILNGLLYKDAKRQLNRFQEFAKYNSILPLTVSAADISAKIYANLRKKGRVISHNDVLIAGTAMTNGLVLITNNLAHFSRINNLQTENWII